MVGDPGSRQIETFVFTTRFGVFLVVFFHLLICFGCGGGVGSTVPSQQEHSNFLVFDFLCGIHIFAMFLHGLTWPF